LGTEKSTIIADIGIIVLIAFGRNFTVTK
jgi:hypothetical protein